MGKWCTGLRGWAGLRKVVKRAQRPHRDFEFYFPNSETCKHFKKGNYGIGFAFLKASDFVFIWNRKRGRMEVRCLELSAERACGWQWLIYLCHHHCLPGGINGTKAGAEPQPSDLGCGCPKQCHRWIFPQDVFDIQTLVEEQASGSMSELQQRTFIKSLPGTGTAPH